MSRALAVATLAIVAAGAGVPASSPKVDAPAAWVVRIGRGAGPWRLHMKLAVRPGLVAIERYPENDSAVGCTSWSRVDHYRDVRVAWQFAPDARHSELVDVATSRPGDRSEDGFVIARARLRAVLARHPQRPQRPRYAGVLGVTLLTVERSTGEESAASLKYWFDAANVLVALETQIGGC